MYLGVRPVGHRGQHHRRPLVATPASYELNRKWAWRKGGKSHLWRGGRPVLGAHPGRLAGLNGDRRNGRQPVPIPRCTGLARAVAIMGASLFAYGVVWIGKFFLFNRLIFATASGLPAPADGPRCGQLTPP